MNIFKKIKEVFEEKEEKKPKGKAKIVEKDNILDLIEIEEQNEI